jgi:hypothetical protein
MLVMMDVMCASDLTLVVHAHLEAAYMKVIAFPTALWEQLILMDIAFHAQAIV